MWTLDVVCGFEGDETEQVLAQGWANFLTCGPK